MFLVSRTGGSIPRPEHSLGEIRWGNLAKTFVCSSRKPITYNSTLLLIVKVSIQPVVVHLWSLAGYDTLSQIVQRPTVG